MSTMSLLALMADKFELEQPDDDAAGVIRSVDEHYGGENAGGSATFSLLDSPSSSSAEEVGKQQQQRQQPAQNKSSLSVDKSSSVSDGDGTQRQQQHQPLGSPSHHGTTTTTTVPHSPHAEPGVIVADASVSNSEETKLLITFLLMVIVGTANKVFQKLQAIPMYNYPNSLNLLQNFVYVPLCFAYILPVSRFGLFGNAIPHEVSIMPKKPFAIMGFLDCLTCLLLTFAAVYLPGSLLILLPQAAIPISMILSKKIKGEQYAKYQYLGAFVVVLGILVVLEPLITQRHEAEYTCEAYNVDEFCALCEEETTEEGCLSHRTKGMMMSFFESSGQQQHVTIPFLNGEEEDHAVVLRSLAESNSTESSTNDGELCRWISSESAQPSSTATTTTLVWSVVTILACIPMTLSSIYKERALSGEQTNIDPIFLNGWVALFQLLFSFPLSVPAGMTSNPPVTPMELPKNIWDGIKCYLGTGTIDAGCHPDDKCMEAPLYVNMFLVFNVCFNILIVYILKFGSANVLFMASTVMVPIGNLAFAMPFMPGSTPLKDSDVAGLMVILFGLVTYRFGNAFKCLGVSHWRAIPPLPWRRGKIRYRRDPGILLNGEQFEWDAPVYDDDDDGDESAVLRPTSSLLEEPLLTPVR
mmetsp:Transcript_7888/g.17119  ORF Transcript_7888/g.17119 Transcript_7888/m.17119 type:complete len:640 (-) Transcript_7888:89-2008(-)